MEIPQGFMYKDALKRGRPRHSKFDDFYIRHPFMEASKRAKIFAPFDALTGFSELLMSKEVHYVEKSELDEQRRSDLSRKTGILCDAVKNSRDAREKAIEISVTYYSPCTDILNEAYGAKGQYITETGILRRIDAVYRLLQVNSVTINFDDIFSIEGDIFTDNGRQG